MPYARQRKTKTVWIAILNLNGEKTYINACATKDEAIKIEQQVASWHPAFIKNRDRKLGVGRRLKKGSVFLKQTNQQGQQLWVTKIRDIYGVHHYIKYSRTKWEGEVYLQKWKDKAYNDPELRRQFNL